MVGVATEILIVDVVAVSVVAAAHPVHPLPADAVVVTTSEAQLVVVIRIYLVTAASLDEMIDGEGHQVARPR